jgi:predicted nucleic acid-binding protein
MAVLLDSAIVVDCLRGRDAASVYFAALPAKPSISALTLSEVYAGVRNRREEDDAARFWSLVNVLPATDEIARRAGVFVRLYRASHNVEVPDAIIAATAEHHGLKLATLNVRHFPMFRKLKPAY